MKVVIPLAGLGTRLRPHTYSKPKPLVGVAGKPVLGHLLDKLPAEGVGEVIFITGYLGDKIEEYVSQHYRFPARYVEQKELRGQAHALSLVREYVDEPVLIVFADTIFEADLARLRDVQSDGVIHVREVTDPRRFGVAVVQDGRVVRLVEKPKEPVSNLAVIGVYYVKNWSLLFEAIAEVLRRGIQTGGEYYLADALQIMIDRGARLEAWPVEVWEDCGTVEALLHTNRYLLDRGYGNQNNRSDQAIVVPPVHIAPTARLERAIVGPYVSIDDGAVVRDSIVQDSIIADGAVIEGMRLAGSLIGSQAVIRGGHRRLNVGDSSHIDID